MIPTLAILLTFAPPQLGPDVELEDYVIQPGDSCASIARRRFGKGKHYRTIHRFNDLGALPHALEPGKTLRLPKTIPRRPDAEVTRAHRRVQARPPETAAWSSASVGQDLFRGWRVNTQAQATAEVTFQDNSQIFLRENTLVIIYGGAGSSKARRRTTTARLDRGALRSSLGSLSGKKSVKIVTPSSETELRGGAALVMVDEEGAARVANHGDGEASVVSTTKRKRRVKVARGMGSKIEKGREPTPPKPLPPTPAWLAGQTGRVATAAGSGATISGAWEPVGGAASYQVEIGRDEAGGFVSNTVTVPKSIHTFEVHNVEPGEYFAIVSAVDDDHFESIPSRMRNIDVTEVEFAPVPGGILPAPEPPSPGVKSAPRRLLLGSRLVAPSGWQCSFGTDPGGQRVHASGSGVDRVSCLDSAGAAVEGFDVTVDRIEAAGGGTSSPVEVSAGGYQPVAVPLTPGTVVPDGLELRPPEGIEVRSVSFRDGRLEFEVRASREGETTLDLVAGKGDEAVVVGNVAMTILPPGIDPVTEPLPIVPWIKRWRPSRHLVEIGAFSGVFFRGSAIELFSVRPARADLGARPLPFAAPMFGVGAAYLPLPHLGMEAEGAVMPISLGGPATMWTLRGSLVAQLGLWSVTPYVVAGGGALAIASNDAAAGNDVDPSLHFGGGLKLFVARRVMLRLDVRDTMSPTLIRRRGAAHSISATLGMGVTLNRK